MVERPPTFNELLIREVQNHPELYDQQHRVCTDNEERNLMWEVIARRIDNNVTGKSRVEWRRPGFVLGEFAKKRWLQMRDRYRKELKMALRNMTQPKWPYFEKLAWLDPYLKDAKSAGLNPLFMRGSFDGADQTPASTLESLMKDEVADLHDFQQYANANALLENIMAASSSAFEQLQRHRETGEFSPDSAIASTSDDGDPPTRGPLISSTAASEAGSSSSASGTSDETATRQRASSSPERQDETNNGLENPKLVDPNALEAAELLSASALAAGAENFKFVGSMIRNLSAASLVSTQQSLRPNTRQRNPPYLVRRGGGMKMKPTDGSNLLTPTSTPATPDRSRGLSAFRPLAKTMSVGGGLTSRNAPRQASAERDVATLLEEWRATEWANDEDACFARLVVVRLKKFAAKEKRSIRARISDLLDRQEEVLDE